MFPRTIKPISSIMGINVLYTSTPEGSDAFDMEKMPCWIDHGQGSFGIPSSEGSGIKAAVVIPNTPIDINNDDFSIHIRPSYQPRPCENSCEYLCEWFGKGTSQEASKQSSSFGGSTFALAQVN